MKTRMTKLSLAVCKELCTFAEDKKEEIMSPIKNTLSLLSFVMCLLIMLVGCSVFQKKSVTQIAAETEEDYKLNDEQRIIVSKGNDFSFKIFKKIAESEKDNNVFVSTIGMFYSLNIINNGASGQTQQEICKAMNIAPSDIKAINELCRRFIIGQAKIRENKDYGPSSYMRTATLFQMGEDIDLNNSFQDVLEHDYFAGVIKGNIDSKLQNEINEWCSEQTDGIIDNLPIERKDSETANLLVANYFNGRWIQKFYKEDTKTEPFYSGTCSEVEMMNESEKENLFTYSKLDDFSLLKIPYVGGYRLYVILPEKPNGLVELLQSLDNEKIRDAMHQLKNYTRVNVKLPKFKIDYSFKANDYLKSMGISQMFGKTSDLDRIHTEQMKIAVIKQKAKVILDEDGTRASAITSTSFVTLCSYADATETNFYADHPFAYIITDPFGNYCFMGTFWGNKE